ncbi:acryloyl-CoA reductase [Solirubrobacter sp. CPCC 204708]|uniref:Acryloyl-CoA reductase n=1 Tax=Solirubrobacter deserti TaxID=2282478 RepID=A0ABT4RNC3_9ACTN|nr:acryloyl-CoA reductase [Solirubrobacter deserti]MBE2318423.1 acryloyl-CoA reductase [Solirubrobacter deserti]MDA0140058.1 acryloyl-CoA reductase [Solirubrobacter deserti]
MRAFVAEKTEDGVTRGLREDFELDGEGDVVVDVEYSSVNYKDGLATIAKGQVARISPLVPGIDLAGVTADGRAVLAHGYDLGVSHHGGYAEQARVPSQWLVPLPEGLSARQAMALGTAGYTAARCVIALEAAGLKPGDGPVLVTGASGGVGSTAVDILAARGYEVVASSGKDPDWLRSLGAAEVISREEAAGDASRPMEKSRWAGAVDCVGGATLAGVVRSLQYGAAVTACGNTGGIKLDTTVLPFILRGVSLLGVDSVQTPIEARRETWARLATDLRPPHLDDTITREIALDELETALDAVLKGELQGRTIVKVG